MKININVLRQSIDVVLHRLENLNGETIEINKDYYWQLDSDVIFDLSQQPSAKQCGSLSDDWNELVKLSENPARCNIADIERIAGIMTALSHEISNYENKFM